MIEPPAAILEAITHDVTWRTSPGDPPAVVAALAVRLAWDRAARYYSGQPVELPARPPMPTRLAEAVVPGHDLCAEPGDPPLWVCRRCGALALLERGNPKGDAVTRPCEPREGRHRED